MSKKGFTLVELIVIIILISVVAAIVTPTLLNTGIASKEALKTSKINASCTNGISSSLNK